MAVRYNFRETEAKWQRIWEERKAFQVSEDLSSLAGSEGVRFDDREGDVAGHGFVTVR